MHAGAHQSNRQVLCALHAMWHSAVCCSFLGRKSGVSPSCSSQWNATALRQEMLLVLHGNLAIHGELKFPTALGWIGSCGSMHLNVRE
jgi:hypothetical protein